MVNSISL